MYKKILVPLDGSDLAEVVLPHLEAVAGGCKISEVVLVRVVEPVHIPRVGGMPMVLRDQDLRLMEEQRAEKARAYLDQKNQELNLPGADIRMEVLHGPVAETLSDFASGNEVDLIIIATHGRSGATRWVWGSVADRMLRSSCVPIMMVRGAECAPGI